MTTAASPDRYAPATEATFATDLSPGVSWAAVLAGAAGAASLSLVLLMLGVGLGFSSVSPWSGAGLTAGTLGVSAIAWLTFTQLAASGMGGYLAGRLRTRWASIHSDEVYFRDTAHGFLAWSVATLLTAALLTGAVGSIVGAGVQAGATTAGAVVTAGAAGAAGIAAKTGGEGDGTPGLGAYFVDSLFRASQPADMAAAPASAASAPSTSAASPMAAPAATVSPTAAGAAPLAEVARIFLAAQPADALPPEDVRYVGQLVAARTGIPQPEAEKRVTDTYAKLRAKAAEAETRTREAADTARKATAYASIWMVVSLLIGAFVASFAATLGGRRRDY